MTAATIPFFALTQTAEAPQMTTDGWVFMIGAWACTSLAIFCFSRVLRKRKK